MTASLLPLAPPPEPPDAPSGAPSGTPPAARVWVPDRVLVTPGALRFPHGAAMVDRAAALGSTVVRLGADRLAGLPTAYRDAKRTLAVIVASPSRRRPQPIPPSADWRFDLAEGCPAHCQYCYLAGSLGGPPIIRAYANLPEILAELPPLLGHGTISSAQPERAAEGTTFEGSCYTDPLGIEPITGSLAETIRWFGAWDAPVQFRFTTKYDGVEPLLALPHRGRTRIRFSLNSRSGERFEGGAPRMPRRLRALRQVALAGYPVGLTIAPILPLPGWRAEYEDLFREVAAALDGVAVADLTAELITHRFTDRSKQVLEGWYPGSALPMDAEDRTRKLTKFGTGKWVLPKAEMRALRAAMEDNLSRFLPAARLLYWT